MNHTVYLKLSQITELTHKDVVLKDVAQVYCDDQNVMNKCNSMKVMTVKVDAKRRYIMSALDVINKLKQLDSTIDVNNVGGDGFYYSLQTAFPACLHLAVDQDCICLPGVFFRRCICHYDL